MKTRTFSLLLTALVLAACAPRETAPLSAPRPEQLTAAPIIVTPTNVPTLVPTAARYVPSPTPSAVAAVEQPPEIDAADCGVALQGIYAAASDHCLAGPTGAFCSGGLAPMVQPATDALDSPGALLDVAAVDALHSQPLDTASGGGLVWLRLEENILVDALLVGDVRIRNLVSPDSNVTRWRALSVESGANAAACAETPPLGALVVQGLYGRSASLGINGISLTINGTLIALTQAELSKFMVIEGEVALSAFGNTVTLNVGEQLNFHYAGGDWSRPLSLPGAPVLLEYDLIKHLPVELFDRPVPIPQPGFAQTQGGVNMRAAPDISARLLFQVPAGHTMGVLGISSDRRWLHIRFGNGETGWMSAELLVRRLGQVPQIYDLTPPPPQRYGVYADRATVNVRRGGNLREAPDTAFRVRRTLPYGTEVKLLARSPYSPWVQVEGGGDVGWMALFTLETEAVISSLPIDYNVPLPPRATATPSFSYGGGHAYPDPSGGY